MRVIMFICLTREGPVDADEIKTAVQSFKEKAGKSSKKAGKPSSAFKSPLPLKKKFWQEVTPDELREKIKNVENINEFQPKGKRGWLHFLVQYGKYPEMVSILASAGDRL